ncbi:archaemetzincin family Zn-dependent metalloprotease [Thermodesulfobacteriota bacterium]
MQNIVLIPIGTMKHDVVGFLTLSLPEILHTQCRIMEEEISIEPFYSSDRKQYHSTEILRQLLPFAAGNEYNVLGIMDKDIYIPILTFVFGEAQLSGRCALMSGHRLHQEFYGLAEDELLYMYRCEKEAVHEIGHTLGLKHCQNFECVMRYSNSVADIDIKRNVFCPSCSEVLGIPSLW